MDTIHIYDRDAEAFATSYESRSFEQVHREVLEFLPERQGLVLDVGAGSGRDAAWFASHGHVVVAVEPAKALRAIGERLHPGPGIRWLDDRLPALSVVTRGAPAFDLVWVSAVWMHLAPSQRARAFRKLAALLHPGGRLILTLREGPSPDERVMYPATSQEVIAFAHDQGLGVVAERRSADALGRAEVRWHSVVLQAPDDGQGALPLLRHIILNDNKRSTYKLALLRVLVRIADSSIGVAEEVDDTTVALPLGLVALYWVRAFKPLVEAGVPQMPVLSTGAGLGFVKEGFRGLASVSSYSLRLGARFSGPEAASLHAALRDARNTIARMPAHYITYPGQERQVFVAEVARARRTPDFTLAQPFLWTFGRLLVPRHLWQAMTRYAAWIEPALIEEWLALMETYGGAARGRDQQFRLLRWLDPEHDTRLVRQLAVETRQRQGALHCVWSGRRLTDDIAIDHCLPFAAWPCNDLWNLLPSHPKVNLSKGARLPSIAALASARDRIEDWWHRAYLARDTYAERFLDEAAAALPCAPVSAVPSERDVFEGLIVQQGRLRRDLRLKEWSAQARTSGADRPR